ncbi:hypothetical protein HF086_008511 [Spodoptera exigua]|uniref:Uncharacterized protein n=1 Tax=Spodoptera exigua TaxID=7107 RepID=A0A922M9I1_SPOEX|nr:hypothetical protein HF086_008511 [Spodoptera exigua]
MVASYIKVCQRNDPEVDKCIMNSVDMLRPKMIESVQKINKNRLVYCFVMEDESLITGIMFLKRGSITKLVRKIVLQ